MVAEVGAAFGGHPVSISDSKSNEAVEVGKNRIIKRLGEEFALDWVKAVYLYDHGDPTMVAELIRLDPSGMLSKDNVKNFLIQVVRGERKCARPKGYSSDQQDRLSETLRCLYLGEVISGMQKIAGPPSEHYGIEPSEWIAKLKTVRAKNIRTVCDRLNLSDATVKGDIRELRKRVNKYPEL